MRRTAFYFVLIAVTVSVAQHDRGSVGRAGGSRAAHEQQQSELLAQNNDPRFVEYRKLIGKSLGKSVGQIAIDYDRLVKKRIQLSPQQFLAIQLAAKQANVDTTVLAASVAPKKSSGQTGMLAVPLDTSFEERLATSLELLSGMAPSSARDIAEKVVNSIEVSSPQK